VLLDVVVSFRFTIGNTKEVKIVKYLKEVHGINMNVNIVILKEIILVGNCSTFVKKKIMSEINEYLYKLIGELEKTNWMANRNDGDIKIEFYIKKFKTSKLQIATVTKQRILDCSLNNLFPHELSQFIKK
jgi:hypothetical protein